MLANLKECLAPVKTQGAEAQAPAKEAPAKGLQGPHKVPVHTCAVVYDFRQAKLGRQTRLHMSRSCHTLALLSLAGKTWLFLEAP